MENEQPQNHAMPAPASGNTATRPEDGAASSSYQRLESNLTTGTITIVETMEQEPQQAEVLVLTLQPRPTVTW